MSAAPQAGEPGLELRLLGPLEALDRGRLITLGGAKPRALLTVLLLELGRVVSVDRLVDELWGERAPQTAAHAAKVYVSQLRKALGPGGRAIVTRPPGYLLELDPEQVDVHRFQRLADEGRAALHDGDAGLAALVLREALSLWRGPALADFGYEPFAQAEIARLEELRLVALEERIEADLALGRHADLAAEIEALIRSEPLRERLRGQLMLALYRSGRQAEALAAYQDARRALVDGLGIEPGPALRELEAAILRQDESLLLPTPVPASPPAAAMQFRRLSIILSAEVDVAALAGALDAETAHAAVERYAEAAVAIAARHGAAAERGAGDVLTAVFGLPVAHEDDALRAARAALEIRDAVRALNESLAEEAGARLDLRVGVDAGEVVSGRTVSGPPLKAAAHLRQLCGPDEVLVGAPAFRLLAHAALVEPVDGAYRLVDVAAGAAPAFERRLDAPLVGRRRELAALRAVMRQAIETESVRIVGVLGPAGIGKSRLARELTTRAKGVSALTGRCVSYGEGITYWPLREIVQGAVGGDERAAILASMKGEVDAAEVADGLAAALGPADAHSAAPEIAWAFRRFCETLARRRPLLLVLDDLHWAEPTLLDLVEHLADRGTGPMLVLCLAREDLVEERPAFLEGRANAEQLVLDSLSPAETEALLDQLGGAPLPEERARIVETAEGNPLFVEQLLALAAEGGLGPERLLPPTIRALMASRLDRLGPGERAVLERGAVVGREFRESELVALLDPGAAATVGRHLQTLVRRGFVGSARDGFRFRHVVVQEAVSRATTKELRAQPHERFAARIERGADDGELDELAGYHLEQAYRLRVELGRVDQHLAQRAGARLGAAGMRAWKRADAPATVNLLGRAADLLPERDEDRLGLLCELGAAFKSTGEDARAGEVLDTAIELARAAGSPRLELRARIEHAWPRLLRGEADAAETLALAEQAVAVFEAERDDRALARAWLLVAAVNGPLKCQWAACEEAAERALEHTLHTGFSPKGCFSMLAAAAYFGPRPGPAAIALCEELLVAAADSLGARADVLLWLGCLEAAQRRFDSAREQMHRAREIFEALGYRAGLLTDWALAAAEVELLADRAAAAERILREAYEALEESTETAWLSMLAATLAEALYAQQRYGEALRLSQTAATYSRPDDRASESSWRMVRARALAKNGAVADGERLAREAVGLLEESDGLSLRGKALLSLAEVLSSRGRDRDAAAAAEQSLELLEAKSDVAGAERARALLAQLKAEIRV